MALSDDLKRGQVGASLKGAFYQYRRGGQWVTSKWPKKRGPARSVYQQQAQDDFSTVCKAIKRTAAPIQTFHRLNAQGTPMLPRDTLMAAYYGNGPTITLYDGRIIKPMANRLLASTVLDALSWTKGDLLVRGDNYWISIPKGEAGQVLRVDPITEEIGWADAVDSGGSGGYQMFNLTGQMTDNAKYKGGRFAPLEEMRLRSLFFQGDFVSGQVVDLDIVAIDATRTVIAKLYHQGAVAIGDGTQQLVGLQFEEPIILPARQYVAIVLSPSGGTATTQCLMWYSSAPTRQIPTIDGFPRAQLAAATLDIGSQFATTSGNPGSLTMGFA